MVSRELIALHESGHAAAMREVGALNGTVELNGHGGSTSDRDSWGWNLFIGSVRTRGDELMVAIAGPLVQSWYCRDSFEELLAGQTGFDGEGDGDRVLAALEGDPLDHWVRKTQRLLRGCANRIEELADVLCERGRLEGDEAKAILAGRW